MEENKDRIEQEDKEAIECVLRNIEQGSYRGINLFELGVGSRTNEWDPRYLNEEDETQS